MKWIYIIILTLGAQCSFANVGTITEQVDAVPNIHRSKQILPGHKGTGVNSADMIKTTRGKAGITFVDNTKVQVNEGSSLTIDEFVYDPKNKAAGKLAINLANGTARYASGAIAKNDPSKVSINTPTATIAVRGTDFSMTVDEIGISTIILLPSCPDKANLVVERDCVTGIIDVKNAAGIVTLDKPFEATKVEGLNIPPSPPVVLSLSESSISNMLILTPPSEIKQAQDKAAGAAKLVGTVGDALKGYFVVKGAIEDVRGLVGSVTTFMDQDFVKNILSVAGDQLNQRTAGTNIPPGLLPDYKESSGVMATVGDQTVQLCLSGGSKSCITTDKYEHTTVNQQQQGGMVITNRVNSGTGTTISIRQN